MRIINLTANLLFLVFVFANTADACVCVEMSPAEFAKHSTHVFIGKVVDSKLEQRKINDFEPEHSFTGNVQISTINITETFIGDIKDKSVTVETDNYSSCSFSLFKNVEYLVYATVDNEGEKLTTGMCSGTKELKAAEADLKVLRSISDEPAISTQISTNKPVDVKDVQARISQDWIKDAVIYEIFPRQYSAEGNFNGITKDLDRLQKLGVTVLWLMPIHPIGEAKRKGTIGSPYAVKDFYAINPDYGTAADLKRLVAESHKRGMKVIIDIVANHTAWDSVMMKTPAFYSKNEKGEIISPVPDWADVADLNYDNPELRKYMMEMLRYWVREFDLDGFRCDVAGFVPTDFWEEARAEVDKVKADTIWLAEWESPDLLVKAFNLDYSWAMHSTLDKVFHGDAPASDIRKTWEADKAKMPKNALRMRFSDNHDERRAIARFGEKGALAAQALAFTLDGVPMFYNGMEAGDTAESGAPALFEKLPIFWGIAERRQAFPKFYQQMISLRRDHVALRRGELEWINNSDEGRILTFTRKSDSEELLIVINTSNRPFFGTVGYSDAVEEITPGDLAGRPRSALPAINLDSFGFRIFKRK